MDSIMSSTLCSKVSQLFAQLVVFPIDLIIQSKLMEYFSFFFLSFFSNAYL